MLVKLTPKPYPNTIEPKAPIPIFDKSRIPPPPTHTINNHNSHQFVVLLQPSPKAVGTAKNSAKDSTDSTENEVRKSNVYPAQVAIFTFE